MRLPSLLLCALCAPALFAQQAQAPVGMAPVWDVKATLLEVSAHAERLLPVLDQIDAKEWMARGASETYSEQLQSCKEQCKAIAETSRELAKQPEKLAAALELYFRLHALDNMLVSLQEGIRRYQNPAVADMLAAVAAEKSDKRQGFERFLVELAATREQQLVVMDAEAQRCRGNLSRQMPVIPTSSRPAASSTTKPATSSGTAPRTPARSATKKSVTKKK